MYLGLVVMLLNRWRMVLHTTVTLNSSLCTGERLKLHDLRCDVQVLAHGQCKSALNSAHSIVCPAHLLNKAHHLKLLAPFASQAGTMKRVHPRSTLKRILKGKKRLNVSKSADLAVSLALVIFLKSYLNHVRS